MLERSFTRRLALLLPLAATLAAGDPPRMSPEARPVEHAEDVFRPDPSYEEKPYDPAAQEAIYGGKREVVAPRPLIEWGRPLYDRGPFDPSGTWLGEKNPTAQHFMAYGDLRAAAAWNDDGVPVGGETEQSTVAVRLNLELDWKLTATERFHVFVRPFDEDGQFLRYDLGGKNEGFEESFDFDVETAFFEGELGPIVAGLTGEENAIDLPFAVGLVPLLTQNGTWLLDAFTGFAFTLPAKSSRRLDVSNFDLTFFAGFDRVTTAAVAGDDGSSLYGFAGFAEAGEGYWEFGYGFLDADDSDLSYHNATVAFSRRYGGKLSNSVRLVGNFGQPGQGGIKTADGLLVLVESSFITSKPQTFVPYLNLFAGFDTPQALARAAGTGGVLANTGINFESDGLTGFPTLDDSGHDAWGGAFGLQNLFNLDRQLVFEVAAVAFTGDREALGHQVALGARYQQPISSAWIVRADLMHAWRDGGALPPGVDDSFFGARLEIRRKF